MHRSRQGLPEIGADRRDPHEPSADCGGTSAQGVARRRAGHGRRADQGGGRRRAQGGERDRSRALQNPGGVGIGGAARSEEHTSELQSLMRISYAVFCLKKKKKKETYKSNYNKR